jgi:hypothetical protein
MGASLTKPTVANVPFAVLGVDSTTGKFNVAATTNGTTWTSAASVDTTANPNLGNVTPNSGFKIGSTYYWMSGPGSAAYACSSSNWSSFTYSTNTTSNLGANGATWNGTGLVTGRTTMIVQSTTDFNTWSSSTAIGSGNNFRAAVYNSGRWVVVGGNGNTGGGAWAWTNTNANGSGSWTNATTQMTSAATNVTAQHVTYAGGKYVAVGGGTTNATTYTSTDGLNWTSNGTVSGFTVPFLTVAGNGTNYVALTGSASGAYSTNGSTWSSITMPSYVTTNATVFKCVIYGNGYYVACGDSGTIMYSTDGINWTAATHPFPTTTTFYSIIAG